MKLRNYIAVKIPTVPNYLIIAQPLSLAGETVAIGDLTDEQLMAIGVEWTKDLIKNAQNKRHLATLPR